MKLRSLVLVTVAAAMAPPAVGVLAMGAAAAGTTVKQNGFKVTMPKAWKSLPQVANEAANNILGSSTEITGGAIAYGDTQAGVFTLVAWVDSKKKVQSVRPELEDFHAGMKSSLEQSLTITSWTVTETATRMTSRGEGGTDELKLRSVAIAAIDTDGILHGWSAQCIYTAAAAKKAVPQCDAVLASFAVTVADSKLRKLEKKSK